MLTLNGKRTVAIIELERENALAARSYDVTRGGTHLDRGGLRQLIILELMSFIWEDRS
jgi:hypothetical protein